MRGGGQTHHHQPQKTCKPPTHTIPRGCCCYLALAAALLIAYHSVDLLFSVLMNPSVVNSASRSVLRTLARRAGPASASSIPSAAACATHSIAAFSSMASPVAAAAEMASAGVTSSGAPRRVYSSTSTLSSAAAPPGEEILAHFGDRASSFQGTDIVGDMESLAKADAVCFDVDSTVIDEEGIVSWLWTWCAYFCFVFINAKPELVGPSWPRCMPFTSAPPCVLGRGEQ